MTPDTTAPDVLTTWLRHVIAVHFDPDGGSPYWLGRAADLGIDPRERIGSPEDLPVLGPMDSVALAERPVEDFVPASQRHRREEFVVAETAGTLGPPKFAVHREDEFDAAFVQPFLSAASRAGFPRGQSWLFIGPSGPHVIGKAARCCAKAMGSPDPFTTDFDPRWAKTLVAGTFAWGRYLKHIEDQALRVLQSQRIGVIFATPRVLTSLSEKMDAGLRERIGGLHLGGMAAGPAFREKLGVDFPNAVVLSGYGNTLFGMMPELNYSPDTGTDYYPHGRRLITRIIEQSADADAERLTRPMPYGERGQVVVNRLDELQFIPNMIERDTAVRIGPPESAAGDGFVLDGLREPEPIVDQTTRPVTGLY